MLTIADMRVWIGQRLELEEDDWFAESTILRWVHRLGFKVHTMNKSIYVDGHEREDVIRDRMDFISKYDEIRKKSFQVDEKTLEEKPNAHAKFIFVSQDEKIHHSNEL